MTPVYTQRSFWCILEYGHELCGTSSMALNHINHQGGPLELHGHVTVPKKYHGTEEISDRTYPLSQSFFIAQLMRMAVIMAFISIPAILGPLLFVRASIGGFEVAVLLATLLYAILLTLYALYLNVWIRKLTFHFFSDYIEVCTGVLRRAQRCVPFSDMQGVRVVQGMFERMGNVAHVHVDTAPTAAPLGGQQSGVLTIPGLSLGAAYHLAQIIHVCIHPEIISSPHA